MSFPDALVEPCWHSFYMGADGRTNPCTDQAKVCLDDVSYVLQKNYAVFFLGESFDKSMSYM